MQAPDFAAPMEVPLTLGALQLTVRPASVGQLARLLSVAGPLVSTLMALPGGLLERLDAPEQLTADDVAELFDLLARHPARLIDMVAATTALPADQVQALPADQFAYLFAVVVQVNADFFSRARPAFAAAARVLREAKDRAPATPGPAPSTA